MTALPYSLAELNEGHLEALLVAEASESATLEFKAAPYAADHDGAKEFLKDATALANTAGGVILIGVREESGVAAELTPLDFASIDKIKLRLESLLQTAVEPRVFGIEMRGVPVQGGCVLAIRVPRSQAPPHRMTAKGANRFYLRSSAGAYEASMDELRALFLQTAAVQERVIAFRDARLAALAEGKSPIPISEEPDRFVLHIAPISAFALAPMVDLAKAEQTAGSFRPLDASGWNSCFNAHGFLNSRGGKICHGYTQLFREGLVEAVYCGVTHGGTPPELSAPGIASSLAKFAPMYIRNLANIGATPPFFILVSLVGVAGALVTFNRHRFSGEATPLIDDLLLPIAVIPDLGSDASYVSALKPALDALWNAGDQPAWTPPHEAT